MNRQSSVNSNSKVMKCKYLTFLNTESDLTDTWSLNHPCRICKHTTVEDTYKYLYRQAKDVIDCMVEMNNHRFILNGREFTFDFFINYYEDIREFYRVY